MKIAARTHTGVEGLDDTYIEISELFNGISLKASDNEYSICERDGDMWLRIGDEWFPMKELMKKARPVVRRIECNGLAEYYRAHRKARPEEGE